MSENVLLRGLFFTILSLGIVGVLFSRDNAETGKESSYGNRQRYLPYIPGNLLPVCVLTLAVFSLIYFKSPHIAAQMTLSMCFGIFLHISLYYVVLIFVLPLLRKRINSRACAMLWMIPNYLYLTQFNYLELSKPLLVIRAPERLVWSLFYVWLTGFFVVFIWKVIAHLVFRSRILKNAEIVTDSKILKLWNDEIARAKIQKPICNLLVSPNITTPLSIGLFRCTTRVVIPRQEYSPDELSLIFRHEIIHIGREDVWSKFFLIFCTAMCWFNPLMWMAMRKSANDLELSCDETVLLDCDEDTRRRYASLILNTTGNEHGFTTCLSASASAMRYRLKNIMKPKKRRSGALAVGLVFFLLCMSYGYVALAYGNRTGAEVIYQSGDTGLYTLEHITMNGGNTVYKCTDTAAFHEYMAGLTMDNLTGNYSFTENENQLVFIYSTPDGTLGVTLSDYAVKLISFDDGGSTVSYYYLPDGVDWEYLNTIILAQ